MDRARLPGLFFDHEFAIHFMEYLDYGTRLAFAGIITNDPAQRVALANASPFACRLCAAPNLRVDKSCTQCRDPACYACCMVTCTGCRGGICDKCYRTTCAVCKKATCVQCSQAFLIQTQAGHVCGRCLNFGDATPIACTLCHSTGMRLTLCDVCRNRACCTNCIYWCDHCRNYICEWCVGVGEINRRDASCHDCGHRGDWTPRASF